MKMHSFFSCVELLLTICQKIIDINTNVLRFAMAEVVLNKPRKALCAPVCMYQKSTIIPVFIGTKFHMLQWTLNVWFKYRMYFNY